MIVELVHLVENEALFITDDNINYPVNLPPGILTTVPLAVGDLYDLNIVNEGIGLVHLPVLF